MPYSTETIRAKLVDVLGSKENAERWLNSPAMALENRKPIALLQSPAGVKEVEDHVCRMEFGIYC